MRRLYKFLLAAAVFVLIVPLAAVIVFQTDWFKKKVRERIVAEADSFPGIKAFLQISRIAAVFQTPRIAEILLASPRRLGLQRVRQV